MQNRQVSALSVIQAAGLTHYSHEKYLRKNFAVLPKRFRKAVNDRYISLFEQKSFRDANLMLGAVVESVADWRGLLAGSDAELCEYAKNAASQCFSLASHFVDADLALQKMIEYALRKGIKPPQAKTITPQGQRARLLCEKWWRRAIRKTIAREVEGLAIDLGLVCKQKGIYASDETCARRGQQKRRNSDLLKTIVAVNEQGDEYTLEALSALNVSNPEIRRAELMTRIAGFDEYAVKHNHAADFYTLTCPSKYHAIGYDGKPNPKYEKYTPKQAQAFLSKTWAQVRAYLAKRGVKVYGFRVAEAHHDGTPHWHMLIFCERKHNKLVRQTIRNYWLGIRRPSLTCGEKVPFTSDYLLYGDGEFRVKKNTGLCLLDYDGNEAGASEHRCKVEAINRKKGTAAGYLAKYISKNIDAHGLEGQTDDEGGELSKNINRVDAWASCWGIRQFQQIGGAPVGVYREVRRLGSVADKHKGIVSEFVSACDKANWEKYTELQGGGFVSRKDLIARVAYIRFENKRSIYDGLGVRSVDGVSILRGFGGYLETRVHEWELKRGGEVLPSWSSVNNCNQKGENLRPLDEKLDVFVRPKPPPLGKKLECGEDETIKNFDIRSFNDERTNASDRHAY